MCVSKHDHPRALGHYVTQDEWNEAQRRIRDLEEQVTAAWKAADELARTSLEAQASAAEMRQVVEKFAHWGEWGLCIECHGHGARGQHFSGCSIGVALGLAHKQEQ